MPEPGAWSTPEGAASWQASFAQRQQSLAAVTEMLLAEAGVVAGARVLEIGSGTGDLAFLAAERTGPGGSVLATDASAPMLEVAARLAREAGLANLSTRVARAEDLELEPASFDAAISRNCLMFIPDLARALAAVHRALRAGGRFAASVWSPPERNVYHGAPIAAVRKRGAIPSPPPEVVQAFSLHDGQRVAEAFRAAGFERVHWQPVPAPRRFPSLEEAVGSARKFPTFVALMRLLTDDERDRAWAEIEREWSRFATASGVELPGEQLVVAGQA